MVRRRRWTTRRRHCSPSPAAAPTRQVVVRKGPAVFQLSRARGHRRVPLGRRFPDREVRALGEISPTFYRHSNDRRVAHGPRLVDLHDAGRVGQPSVSPSHQSRCWRAVVERET
jgi:hypothetical protein